MTRSDTNQAVQLLEMARGLKFCIWEEEVLYYLGSENKGTDQLRGYREADLRLCFRICKSLVFSRRGSYADKVRMVHSHGALWNVLLTSLVNYRFAYPMSFIPFFK